MYPKFPQLRVWIVTITLLVSFILPTSTLAQSSIDLVIHYVEGLPATNQIAYEVSVYLSVFDSAGNPIKDLVTTDFAVTEDSQPVTIDSVELVSDQSINIALLLDTSGSMSGGGITAARAAASNFIAGLNENDKVAIFTFDDTVRTVIDYTSDHSAARNEVALVEAVPGAGTCLYDAAYQAVQSTATLPSGRRAVILFTDGVDEKAGGGFCSTHTLDDVITLASSGGTRAPIYTLGMGHRIDSITLKRLAELTGGRYLYSPDASQLDAVFLRLSDQLRSQYFLRYISNAGPGAHTLAMGVTYLNATNNDTRTFLLPDMSTISQTGISFTYPKEGQKVSGTQTITVELSDQEIEIARVDFEINDEVIVSDSTIPYEAEVDFGQYSTGDLTIRAVAYEADGEEWARAAVDIKVVESNSTLWLLIFGAGGILLIGLGFITYNILRKRKEQARDKAWLDAQTWEETPSNEGESTIDNLEPSPDALGILIVVNSDDPTMIGQSFMINKPVTTLGRNADNDIIFLKDSPVSRHHAKIEEKQGGLFLSEVRMTDEKNGAKRPTYGTFVNDNILEVEPISLQSGDEIRLGKRVRLKFKAGKSSSGESETYDEFSLEETTETSDDLALGDTETSE